MRALEATALRLFVSSLAASGLACKESPRASPPPTDAGTVVTVYVPPKSVDRLMGRLAGVAARRRWVLSVRTDSAALGEADLVIMDSGGRFVGWPRPGSANAAQAREMAEAVLGSRAP
ncbi:MAG TPA: hypothetical protein VFU41_16245 [Gemmatimonadales bacterium]|nr:hypothetical protein [Gemmatimonadales bacterium]